MATLKFSLIFFYFLYALSVTAASVRTRTKTKTKTNTTFLREQCKAYATFPLLCLKSLKSRAATIGQDKEKLALESLKLARDRTLSAEAYVHGFPKKVKKLRAADKKAIASCTAMVGNSVTQLNRSISVLEKLGTPGTRDFRWTASNLNEGTNCALYGIQSCKDLMADHQNLHSDLRVSLKARMDYVAQVLGNSLALCNSFVYGN